MYCQKCNKQIPDDSEFCPYCGEEILPIIESNKCIRCTKEIPEDSDYCPFCGTKQNNAELADNKDFSIKAANSKDKNHLFLIKAKGIIEKNSLLDTLKQIVKNIIRKHFGIKELIAIVISIILLLSIIIGTVVATSNSNKKDINSTTRYNTTTSRPSFEEILNTVRKNNK